MTARTMKKGRVSSEGVNLLVGKQEWAQWGWLWTATKPCL